MFKGIKIKYEALFDPLTAATYVNLHRIEGGMSGEIVCVCKNHEIASRIGLALSVLEHLEKVG